MTVRYVLVMDHSSFTENYCDDCQCHREWHNETGCGGSYDCSTGV